MVIDFPHVEGEYAVVASPHNQGGMWTNFRYSGRLGLCM